MKTRRKSGRTSAVRTTRAKRATRRYGARDARPNLPTMMEPHTGLPGGTTKKERTIATPNRRDEPNQMEVKSFEAALKRSANRITALYGLFLRSAKNTLRHLTNLGMALTEQQDRVGDERWEWFVNTYLPFSVEVSQRFQAFGDNTELLQSEEFKHLSARVVLNLLSSRKIKIKEH
jgi:hypothetical protein